MLIKFVKILNNKKKLNNRINKYMCDFFKKLFRKHNKKKDNKIIVSTPVFNYDISNNQVVDELPPPYRPLILSYT